MDIHRCAKYFITRCLAFFFFYKNTTQPSPNKFRKKIFPHNVNFSIKTPILVKNEIYQEWEVYDDETQLINSNSDIT